MIEIDELHLLSFIWKQLWASAYCNGYAHTGPGFKTRLVWYFLPSFRLTTTISVS